MFPGQGCHVRARYAPDMWSGRVDCVQAETLLNIYEYDASEIGEPLPFRNTIFGQITVDHWLAMNCTGVVAREDGELVGFIPLQYREQKLNARQSIPVVYENAVGVAEGRRGQGIGTLMMDEAARFMGDRVDALMVIRSGERTDGYRFYRRSGHSDLMYACWYYLSPEVEWPAVDSAAGAARISVIDRESWLALEPQLLALYERRCGGFGGGQRRGPGYWSMILDGQVFAQRKRWLVTMMTETGQLRGYLVAGQGVRSAAHAVLVYEVVGEDEPAVEHLLRFARQLCGELDGAMAARPDGAQLVVPLVSLANPVRPLLRRMGFAEGESSSHVMARLLRPDRIFCRLAEGTGLPEKVSLSVSTPHRVLEVCAPAQPRYTVRLETKEVFLARLFCCRLDLDAALDMELVRWRHPDAGLRRQLCQVFAPCEWVQWFTDYV